MFKRTWMYKDGKSRLFETQDTLDQAVIDGWTDSPDKKAEPILPKEPVKESEKEPEGKPEKKVPAKKSKRN